MQFTINQETTSDEVAVGCMTLSDLRKAKNLGMKTILVLQHQRLGDENIELIDYLEVANAFPSGHFATECLAAGVRTIRPITDEIPVRPGSCYIVRPDGVVEPFSSLDAEVSSQAPGQLRGTQTGAAEQPRRILAMDRFAGLDLSRYPLGDYQGLGPVRMERLLAGAERAEALDLLASGLSGPAAHDIGDALVKALAPALSLSTDSGLPLYVRLPYYRWDEEPGRAEDGIHRAVNTRTLERFQEVHLRALASAVAVYPSSNVNILTPMYQQAADLVPARRLVAEIYERTRARPGVGIVVETLFSSLRFTDDLRSLSTVCIGTNDLACSISGRSRDEVSKLNGVDTELLVDALTGYLATHICAIAGEQVTTVLCGAFAPVLGVRLAARGVQVDAISVRFGSAAG
jgi:hypothetical protein